jgi:molybdopterin-guanine dinucleotide biosynthesis protein MobB
MEGMASQELRIASFFGWSNSGKTTLIAALIEEGWRRGLRCGAAKSSRHPGNFGDEAKDTGRFRASGATPVVYIGIGQARTTAIFVPTPEHPDRAWLEMIFGDVDRLLAEGLEVDGAIRVLVETGDRAGKRSLDEIDLLVSDDPDRRAACASGGKRAFPHEAVGAILDALEETWKGK